MDVKEKPTSTNKSGIPISVWSGSGLVTKKMGEIDRKNTRLQKIIIIITTFGVLAAAISGFFAFKSYQLAQNEAVVREVPFYEYRYSKDADGFTVNSISDHEIVSVSWLLNLSNGWLDIGEKANTATVNTLLFNLRMDFEKFLGSESKLSGSDKGFARCKIVSLLENGDPDSGVSMTVEVEFRPISERITKRAIDLMFMRDLNTDLPSVSVYKRAVSEEEANRFAKQQEKRLQDTYEVLNRLSMSPPYVTENGDCRIRFGTPEFEW